MKINNLLKNLIVGISIVGITGCSQTPAQPPVINIFQFPALPAQATEKTEVPTVSAPGDVTPLPAQTAVPIANNGLGEKVNFNEPSDISKFFNENCCVKHDLANQNVNLTNTIALEKDGIRVYVSPEQVPSGDLYDSVTTLRDSLLENGYVPASKQTGSVRAYFIADIQKNKEGNIEKKIYFGTPVPGRGFALQNYGNVVDAEFANTLFSTIKKRGLFQLDVDLYRKPINDQGNEVEYTIISRNKDIHSLYLHPMGLYNETPKQYLSAFRTNGTSEVVDLNTGLSQKSGGTWFASNIMLDDEGQGKFQVKTTYKINLMDFINTTTVYNAS